MLEESASSYTAPPPMTYTSSMADAYSPYDKIKSVIQTIRGRRSYIPINHYGFDLESLTYLYSIMPYKLVIIHESD